NRTTVNLGSFEIANEGSTQFVDFGTNTILNVTGLSKLNSGAATMNINGAFNSGGLETTATGSALNIYGNSKVDINVDFKVASSVNVYDYSTINVSGNFETSTDRFFRAYGYSYLHISGNHTVNGNAPMFLTNFAQVQIDGNTF